jgi:hypothetical protein
MYQHVVVTITIRNSIFPSASVDGKRALGHRQFVFRGPNWAFEALTECAPVGRWGQACAMRHPVSALEIFLHRDGRFLHKTRVEQLPDI